MALTPPGLRDTLRGRNTEERSPRMTKIALIQQSASPDRMANVEKGLAAVEEAAASGAKLAAFAELAFDPFYPQHRASAESLEPAVSIPGEITERFQTLAKRLGIVVVLNLFERDGEHCFDSSPVIDADGALLGCTRMVHIAEMEAFHETGYYAPGNLGAPVYETAIGKLGVAICYDRHFPEYMRALGVQGADLVVVPQAGAVGEWPDGLYEAELRVAAFQNGYYTALVNRVGKEERLDFAGASFVAAPDGRILAQAGEGVEELLLAEIDLSICEQSHARRLFLRHRRPELYADWIFEQTPL